MIAYPTIMVIFTQFYLGPTAYWARHFQVLGAPTTRAAPNPSTEAPMRNLFKALLPPESIFCGSSLAVTASMPSWPRWG